MKNNSRSPQPEKEQLYQATINDLLRGQSSMDLLRRAVCELLPKKDLSSCICLLLYASLGYLISSRIMELNDASTVELQLCDTIMTVQLAVFSCMFAAYSILLAFLSDDYTKVLAKSQSDSGKSYLIRGIEYFEAALFIFFVAVVFSMAYKGILVCGGDISACDLLRGSGFTKRDVRNLYQCMLVLYYMFSIRTIVEIKSVIYNTTMFFRFSLVSKLGLLEEGYDGEVEENNGEHIE